MKRGPAKITPAQLAGKLVYLRTPTAADYQDYARLIKVSERSYRGVMPKFKGRRQFDDYLQRCQRDDFFGFLICRSSDGVVVGNINLFHVVHRNLQGGTLGYFVGAPHARQGYATEAVQLVLRYAFRTLRLHRIEACIQPTNIPSRALIQRAGFSNEGLSRRFLKLHGRWRDHERWALLVEDWRGGSKK